MFSPHNQKATVLIIDDDEMVRSLLFDVLATAYDCRAAGSAEEGLRELNRKTFDLVLSDIDMGGMSGLELVPHVHSLSPDTVVVMVSGNQDIEFAIKALRVGAFDYITKPAKLAQLETILRKVSEKKELKNKNLALQTRVQAAEGPTCRARPAGWRAAPPRPPVRPRIPARILRPRGLARRTHRVLDHAYADALMATRALPYREPALYSLTARSSEDRPTGSPRAIPSPVSESARWPGRSEVCGD